MYTPYQIDCSMSRRVHQTIPMYIASNRDDRYLFPFTRNMSLYEPEISLPEYMGEGIRTLCDTAPVLSLFPSQASYRKFILDQADYTRALAKVKHLAIDQEQREEKRRCSNVMNPEGYFSP